MAQIPSVTHGMIYTACVAVAVRVTVFQTMVAIVRVVIGIKVRVCQVTHGTILAKAQALVASRISVANQLA